MSPDPEIYSSTTHSGELSAAFSRKEGPQPLCFKRSAPACRHATFQILKKDCSGRSGFLCDAMGYLPLFFSRSQGKNVSSLRLKRRQRSIAVDSNDLIGRPHGTKIIPFLPRYFSPD